MRETRRGTCAPPLLFFVVLHILVAPNAANDRLLQPLLKDVVRAVATKERWDIRTIRATRLDGGKIEVGSSRRYEFHVRAAGRVWVFKVSGGFGAWKEVKGVGGDEELRLELLAGGARRRRPLGSFQLEGPLELRAAGEGGMSLSLPTNATHSGIKKAIVGEGIKVKIKRTLEVSIVVPNDLRFLVNRSLVASKEYKHPLLRQHPSCRQLLAVYVQGSASVIAYKVHNYKTSIHAAFHSPDVVELLPDKCFTTGYFRHRSPIDILSLRSRVVLVEKILRSFLGYKKINAEIPHFVKVKVASATLVKFFLELERDIDNEDREWKKSSPQWKTKAPVERAQFVIIARVEENKQLQPVSIRKLKKPINIVAETTSWSSILSNLSLRFLSSVVPPEPLTLDVKW